MDVIRTKKKIVFRFRKLLTLPLIDFNSFWEKHSVVSKYSELLGTFISKTNKNNSIELFVLCYFGEKSITHFIMLYQKRKALFC
jgi:hypothetical protein